LSGFRKGTVSVAKHADPAERLTKEVSRPSTSRKAGKHVAENHPIDEDVAVEAESPVDDMEEATVTLQTEPETQDNEPSISQDEPSDDVPAVTTRFGRTIQMRTRMRECHYLRAKKWVAWAALDLRPPKLSKEDEIYEIFGDREYDIQDRASDPIAFSATSDPDTMYWHQAM
jgi:hypothetical protein